MPARPCSISEPVSLVIRSRTLARSATLKDSAQRLDQNEITPVVERPYFDTGRVVVLLEVPPCFTTRLRFPEAAFDGTVKLI